MLVKCIYDNNFTSINEENKIIFRLNDEEKEVEFKKLSNFIENWIITKNPFIDDWMWWNIYVERIKIKNNIIYIDCNDEY